MLKEDKFDVSLFIVKMERIDFGVFFFFGKANDFFFYSGEIHIT